MSKEITLSELLNSNTAKTVTPPPAPVEKEPTSVNEKESAPLHEARSIPAPNFDGAMAPGKPTTKVSIDDIASTLPGRPKEEIKNPEIVDNALKAMHDTIAEKKRFFEEEVVPVMEQNAKEMAMEKEMENMGVTVDDETIEDDDIRSLDMDDIDEEIMNSKDSKEEVKLTAPEPQSFHYEEPASVKEEKREPVVNTTADALQNEVEDLDSLLKDLDSDESDLDDDLLDLESEDIEETRNRLKRDISKVIQPSKIDFSEYTVRVKPLAVSAILNNINERKTVKTADWALFGSKRSITVSEGSGPELDALVKSIRNSNAINSAIMSLKLVYNHIVDANKPPFEIWARSVHTEDLDSLYYAFYIATYSDTNMIAYQCSDPDDDKYGCKKTSVLSVDVEKMVKFESPEVEEEFKDLLRHDTTTSDIVETPTLMALSNDIAVTYNKPNLYSTLIQYSALNPKIVDKYDDLLNTLAYIDGFYYIDHSTKELVPIPLKQYPNNLNKTVLEKLKLYGQVLRTLSSDEYDIALTKLSNLGDESKISYVIPEVTCPECGSVIKEAPIDNMLDMVFNRRQLAQIQGL